jgi:hypothetical protein
MRFDIVCKNFQLNDCVAGARAGMTLFARGASDVSATNVNVWTLKSIWVPTAQVLAGRR